MLAFIFTPEMNLIISSFVFLPMESIPDISFSERLQRSPMVLMFLFFKAVIARDVSIFSESNALDDIPSNVARIMLFNGLIQQLFNVSIDVSSFTPSKLKDIETSSVLIS